MLSIAFTYSTYIAILLYLLTSIHSIFRTLSRLSSTLALPAFTFVFTVNLSIYTIPTSHVLHTYTPQPNLPTWTETEITHTIVPSSYVLLLTLVYLFIRRIGVAYIIVLYGLL